MKTKLTSLLPILLALTLGLSTLIHVPTAFAQSPLPDSFNPGTDLYVSSLALQANGKILVGGTFYTLGGQSRYSLGRLNGDGTLDTSFNPGVIDSVAALALQADGKILVGGEFHTLGGQNRNDIGRLNNTDLATQTLSFDGSTLTWMRGGTSPEVWRTTFEYSPDGHSWTDLGAGIRILGGWQLTGLALPTHTALRARGYIEGTSRNGSGGWFVETVLSPAVIISELLYSTNGQFGFTLTGPAGQSVIVEASTNLANWLPVQTNTLTVPLNFRDPQSGALSKRFYRARTP